MATFQIEFFSNTLGRVAPLSVILPIEKPVVPGIELSDRKLPLKSMYLLHGYSGSNNDWIRGSRIEELARIFGVAIVMPAGENSFYLDDKILGRNYEKLICEEIIDFTRKVFPISTKREDTTIAGLSMGGYGAIRNGLKRSDVFGNIAAFSSALITDKLPEMKEGGKDPIAPYSYYCHVFGDLSKAVGSDVDPKALANKLITDKAELPKIFMACGTEDFLLEENRSFDKYLSSIGFQHEYIESPGTHNWVFWDDYIEKAMVWLYGEPIMPKQLVEDK